MSTDSTRLPAWAVISLATNGVLIATVAVLLAREGNWSPTVRADASVTVEATPMPQPTPTPEVGQRQQPSYEDWVAILEKEAEAIAAKPPDRLYVLAGDSISLWFPNELLPPGVTWLNQSISGEGSDGLYNRLPLLDDTEPEKIFINIGINDMLRGTDDETILENHRKIIKDIRWIHPETEIVVQSILPHSAENATWEEREKLLEIPNSRIRNLNARLEAIAEVEGAKFLDLYPLFSDDGGRLRTDYSTDGLHLNRRGYEIWRTALLVFDNERLQASDSVE
ncbi:GDSL-type esterase/lipase family protein [Baaleninema simplex]|uniref:GDSL-type esterase/lipase family protein n=1 Tax=Baaleninema simplex TaxID=2862350 RepID=UPI00034B4A98|nr:GDSL-type esterase/lipase family protein [Baaleninema simplex]